jgi:hypothetical protein
VTAAARYNSENAIVHPESAMSAPAMAPAPSAETVGPPVSPPAPAGGGNFGPSLREKEILLAALAKDVLAARGAEEMCLLIEEGGLIVRRLRLPLLAESEPVPVRAEDDLEIQRRLETLDQSTFLFEIEIDDEEDERPTNAAKRE